MRGHQVSEFAVTPDWCPKNRHHDCNHSPATKAQKWQAERNASLCRAYTHASIYQNQEVVHLFEHAGKEGLTHHEF